jgi:hypothetical protein
MWNFSSSVSNVNVTVDTNLIAQAGLLANPNMTGSPLLYIPNMLSVPLFVNAASSISVGGTISVQSNVINSNCLWVESGVPLRTSNTSYGMEVGPLHQFKLLLNGTDRFVPQFGKYFNQYQPYQYHSGVPYPGIYVYSFALKPEELQPSGTCNFSRIDMAQAAVYLKSTMPGNLLQQMFAVNYNVLKVASGMGGLVFSN